MPASRRWKIVLEWIGQTSVHFLFVCFCGTGVWIQGLTLARQALLIAWATPPADKSDFCVITQDLGLSVDVSKDRFNVKKKEHSFEYSLRK
jgi:hypothetical protein